ncbi:MAG: hypothetical protein DI551_02830 [Micavibrio aeruginosavorus]|uniref:Uncharacterized protein n=1 Tax=Micavibrio aeruginosavorus TaxID=349221 RepID=A0A2W5N3P4_9BACT|nr:MAG: hypothetical protein DI551_02830 [Micavibrio aeruginosavorus]
MQIIEADWQDKIALHSVAMDHAFQAAVSVPPGDEHTKRWDTYEAVSADFLGYLGTHFESDQGFDDFLKSQASAIYQENGYSLRSLQEDWPDFYPVDDTIPRAELALSRYKRIYKEIVEDLESNRQPLKLAGKPQRLSLPAP